MDDSSQLGAVRADRTATRDVHGAKPGLHPGLHPNGVSPHSITLPNRRPHRTLGPRSGWQPINLRQLWHFRDLLLSLAARDVKLRYRQTALGVLWVVLQPLVGALVFAFVFGTVAKLPDGGVPPLALSFAGLLAWNAFNTTLTKASTSLIQNAQLISKVFFPRLLLPVSTVFAALIDFAVSLAVMAVILGMYRIVPGPGLLLLPLWTLLILLLALGLGLFAAALAVSYRDVQYILPVLTPFLLYASPVGYSAAAVPARWQALYFLNPLTSLLEAFRWSLLGHGDLRWGYLGYAAAMAIGVFIGGAFAFRRMERWFADVI